MTKYEVEHVVEEINDPKDFAELFCYIFGIALTVNGLIFGILCAFVSGARAPEMFAMFIPYILVTSSTTALIVCWFADVENLYKKKAVVKHRPLSVLKVRR